MVLPRHDAVGVPSVSSRVPVHTTIGRKSYGCGYCCCCRRNERKKAEKETSDDRDRPAPFFLVPAPAESLCSPALLSSTPIGAEKGNDGRAGQPPSSPCQSNHQTNPHQECASLYLDGHQQTQERTAPTRAEHPYRGLLAGSNTISFVPWMTKVRACTTTPPLFVVSAA